MRDFANERNPKEEQVEPFMNKIGKREKGREKRGGGNERKCADHDSVMSFIVASSPGGYATLFGLIVAISDPLHLQLVRRVLNRLFDETPGGRARLCSPEVQQYLLAGLHPQQLKHVRLVSLQSAHLFISDPVGQQHLLRDELFVPLVGLLADPDVEITEEAVALLRQLGATPAGLQKLMEPKTLQLMFELTLENEEKKPEVVDLNAAEDNVKPYSRLLDRQNAGVVPADEDASARGKIDSIRMMRVVSLLTHIASATRLPAQNEVPKLYIDPVVNQDQLKAHAWRLFQQRGLWHLLLQISSVASAAGGHGDMLVQLNGLELLEEVVASCPQIDDAFAVDLTKQILTRAAITDNKASASGSKSPTSEQTAATVSSSLSSAASFITVGVLRVFTQLARVSSLRSTHSWYRQDAFLHFLSICMNNYDDESVQTEAIDLLCTLSSFESGLRFFSTFTSTLSREQIQNPAQQSKYLSTPYASSLTQVLLHQVPFFVYGSTYATGLRQLAALHGMAKMFAPQYPASAEAPGTEEKASESASATAAAPASSSSEQSASSLLEQFWLSLLKYHPRSSSPLEILWTLAKQPFEDIRDAVFKIIRELAHHPWGVAAIVGTAGFMEYLLDRKSEFTTAGSQNKFDIIRALAASPYGAQIRPEIRAQMAEYVRQGAHYAPLSVQVMGPVSGARS
jgi:hypothetical protein